MPTPDGPWLLLDGNNLASRAMHAQARGMSVGDQPTGMLYVFINMIAKYVRMTNPRAVTVCWDGGYAGRTEVFPGYKANRPPKEPEHLMEGTQSEWALAKEFLALFGIDQQQVHAWEADDLIAVRARSATCPVVIVSGDKDMLQLIQRDGSVVQIKVPEDVVWDADVYAQAKGYPVEKAALVHALVGDTSDGIPGMKGIGPKKALAMLDVVGWDWESLLAQANVDAEHMKIMRDLVDLRDRDYPESLWLSAANPRPFTGVPVDEALTEQWLGAYRMESVRRDWRAGTLWLGDDLDPASEPDESLFDGIT